MANLEISGNDYSVDFRGSFDEQYSYKDLDGSLLDISSWVLFFEVDGNGVSIRQPLIPDPNEPTVQWIYFTSDLVEQLTDRSNTFIIRDETDLANLRPRVLARGTIKGYGFKYKPDKVEG